MSVPTDEDLIRAFQSAHQQLQQAFWELHECHTPDLLRFLKNRLKRTVDVDDLLQQIWMKVYRALPNYRQGHFRGWLFQIARNCLRDWLKKPVQRKEQLVESDDRSLDPSWNQPGLGQNSSQEQYQEEQLDRLQHCLQTLQREQAVLGSIVQGRLQGVAYEQICEQHQLSRDQAYKYHHQGLQWLRHCVGQEQE